AARAEAEATLGAYHGLVRDVLKAPPEPSAEVVNAANPLEALESAIESIDSAAHGIRTPLLPKIVGAGPVISLSLLSAGFLGVPIGLFVNWIAGAVAAVVAIVATILGLRIGLHPRAKSQLKPIAEGLVRTINEAEALTDRCPGW